MAGPVFAALSLASLRRSLAGLGLALGVLALFSFTPVLAPGEEQPLPLAGRRIVIDPGHGGVDPGCHRDGVLEKDLTLQVARLLGNLLADRGAEVTLTRESDTELSHLTESERTRHGRDLAARVLIAREKEAELLVSLHVNAASSPSLGGAILFHHPASEEGRLLAEAILERLAPVVPGNQNGVLAREFYILRHAPMPTVLVELGFLTHEEDRRRLLSDEGPAKMAEAIAQGIEVYIEGDGGPRDRSPAPETGAPPWAEAATRSPPDLDEHLCTA